MNTSDEGTTDDRGITTVSYWPPDHLPGDTLVNINGKTSGENGADVEDTFEILLTGEPQIENFNPASGTATFGQGESQDVNFNVWDVNGSPLSEGTMLNITVNPDTLASVSHNFPEGGLPDRKEGSEYTDFKFTVTDNPSNTSGGELTIKIYVTGRNGNRTVTYRIDLNSL